MRKLNAEVKLNDLTLIEVVIRWITYYLILSVKDGIVIGTSKTKQIRETVMMIKKWPLPGEGLKTADDL